MIAWFFRVILDRVSFSYFQDAGEDVLHNGTLLFRLLFDGKSVDIALPSATRNAEKNKPTSFKYRIQAPSLKDLAATFSERSVCFQVICLNTVEQQSEMDVHSSHGTLVGVASIDLLSLARNAAAQYEFPLRVSDAASDTKILGRVSVRIAMEQICDFRMQLSELRASGLESGEYKLRYVLSASTVDMRSGIVRSKLGSVKWNNEILPEVFFQGTLQALALRDFTLSVLKCGENGKEAPISVFTLSLLKVKTNSYESVKEIPFLIEDVDSPTIVSGVLRLSGLPIFQHYIRYVSNPSRAHNNDEMRKKCKESLEGAVVGESHDVASSNPILTPVSGSVETTAGSTGGANLSLPDLSDVPLLSPSARAEDQTSVRTPLEEAIENGRANLAHSNSHASCDVLFHGTSPIYESEVRSCPKTFVDSIPATASAPTKNEKGKGDGCDSMSSLPLRLVTGGDIEGACVPSIQASSTTEDDGIVEREKHLVDAFSADKLQGENQEQVGGESPKLMYREYRLPQELDRLDERIGILQECLQNPCILAKNKEHDSTVQIADLEQKLSELDVAEAALTQLWDRLHERFMQCVEQYRKSEREFLASMRRIEDYADVLIKIDRRISAGIHEDEMEMPATERTEPSCRPPHPPRVPKPTRS
ncbi:hypothetical protein MOQ_006083 [Trypanosoma cruzi marinkellei]|uniref:C2 NT-type domain-containing protein n=1 Tax=Trypanosoma cruzi marinkellei TaxID=85056 RepID=K2NMQ0_TRYCR|nr:hypothetical protein MOQ_006083 [Trypanosoma cruzi marinkellei]